MHRWLGLGLKRAFASQLRLMASNSSPVRRAAAVGIASFGIGTASLAHPVQLEPSIQTPVCVVVGAGSKFSGNPTDDLPIDVVWGLGGALPLAFARKVLSP